MSSERHIISNSESLLDLFLCPNHLVLRFVLDLIVFLLFNSNVCGR